MTFERPVARATLAAALALLAGCAATAIDDTRAQARADVARALQQPLAEDDAVRIALSCSPALQALLFERAADTTDTLTEAP